MLPIVAMTIVQLDSIYAPKEETGFIALIFSLSYRIQIIIIAKSLRLERSERKQSQELYEIASYRRNDNCSTRFYYYRIINY